jgi:hypothetical protein
MKQGYLSQYFNGVAAKKLSAVEADTNTSNQHEFNGVTDLKTIFGNEKRTFKAKFIYLNDNDDEPPVDDGFLTWYDARENHPKRSEYRMYFSTTVVSICASASDELYIGLRPDSTVLVVIAENGSTICNQLRWLFGIYNIAHPGFSVREELETEQDRIAFASRFILDELGIELEDEDEAENFLDSMLHRFGKSFPTTKEFSSYARSTMKEINSLDDPDCVLVAWLEREEILFRTFEKHIIADDLNSGFSGDVDEFIKFSLSVQNRRKARVGLALENHLEHIFSAHNIRHSWKEVTENKSVPDFIFPGIAEYHDSGFDANKLTMLGSKNTCKDRWRQVLSEADRISRKHLITLEAAISKNQTDEMMRQQLQLVIPTAIQDTYTTAQQNWLMNLAQFIQMVQARDIGAD